MIEGRKCKSYYELMSMYTNLQIATVFIFLRTKKNKYVLKSVWNVDAATIIF